MLTPNLNRKNGANSQQPIKYNAYVPLLTRPLVLWSRYNQGIMPPKTVNAISVLPKSDSSKAGRPVVAATAAKATMDKSPNVASLVSIYLHFNASMCGSRSAALAVQPSLLGDAPLTCYVFATIAHL